jgi:ElaA protein
MNNVTWKIKNFEDLSTKELYKILKVRQEVFIVEQTCYYLDADGYDDKALHIWAETNGEIAAYCRIFSQGIKACVKAPSAKILLNKFGSLKATKNISE